MGGLGGPGITPGARSCDPTMGSLCAPGQSPWVASGQGTCNKESGIRAEPAAGETRVLLLLKSVSPKTWGSAFGRMIWWVGGQ